ncbi:MAG: class I SAM-dependent methyltransferase [Actinomycetota bacterium]
MPADDQWGRGGGYEPYVGRWSRLVATRFIDWLASAPGGRWLDIGCGTGALTETILGAARPALVRGVDPSEEYVKFARDRIADRSAEFEVADAHHLPGDDGSYDYAVSGLVLNFVPNPARALAEMKRVTRAGGSIAAYVWDYAGGMELVRYFWDAATELDRHAASLDEGVRFAICRPEPLRSLWEQAAIREVSVVPIDIDTVFRDFDDYWSPFLGGQGPAPSYAMSLDESARAELSALLRRRLPIQDDGSIRLRARTWGVRGQI